MLEIGCHCFELATCAGFVLCFGLINGRSRIL
jgi:hypothetical protein